MSHRYSLKKRSVLLKEQKNRCFYCGDKLENGGQLDHVIPKNQTWVKPKYYKFKVKKDKVLACSRCNLNKWAYPPIVWKYRLEVYIEEARQEVKRRKRIIRSLNYLLS